MASEKHREIVTNEGGLSYNPKGLAFHSHVTCSEILLTQSCCINYHISCPFYVLNMEGDAQHLLCILHFCVSEVCSG